MIYLNALYGFHKLPPPIPKLTDFFLDNTMLNQTVEYAIVNWSDNLEPCWDEVIEGTPEKKKIDCIRELLKINPNLLAYCSDGVRNSSEFSTP